MAKYFAPLMALASSAAFLLIVSVDQSSNVTARVLDGSIFPLVDRAQTQTYNGVADRHVAAAEANKLYLRRHCFLYQNTTEQDPSGCGYKK